MKKKRSSDVPFAMEEPPLTRKTKFGVSGIAGGSIFPRVKGKHVKIIRIE
jgi:hypothetical protein